MNIDQLKKEIEEAGFRPAPFAFVLWNLRRALWPSIRQYHFYQLEKLVETEQRLEQALAQVSRLTEQMTRLESDLVAVTNRQTVLSDDFATHRPSGNGS